MLKLVGSRNFLFSEEFDELSSSSSSSSLLLLLLLSDGMMIGAIPSRLWCGFPRFGFAGKMNLIRGLSSSPLLLLLLTSFGADLGGVGGWSEVCGFVGAAFLSSLSMRVGMNWFMTSFMRGMSIEWVSSSSSSFTSRVLLLWLTLFWLPDEEEIDGIRDVERRRG